jgi:prefoldin beta subunit
MASDQKIQEISMMEQNLQNLLLQKQAFQMELSETLAAKREIDNAGEDVFKIVGQLMIKTDKEKVKKELENKEKLLGIRVKSFEKQESIFSEKIESLRSEIIG